MEIPIEGARAKAALLIAAFAIAAIIIVAGERGLARGLPDSLEEY